MAEFPLRTHNRLALIFGEYSGGLPLAVPYTVLVGRTRTPKALIIAGVHGDEYEGVAALQELQRELDVEKLNGTMTIIPVANPPAFHAGRRRSPLDEVDLNRTFPGSKAGTPSERLAYELFHDIVLGHEIVLSLHGWGKESVVVSYGEYPKGDSDAAARSAAAAHALGMAYLHPYTWPKGVLGEASLPHGIAAVETEVGGLGTVTAEGQAETKALIYRFLHHLGMWTPAKKFTGHATPQIVSHVDSIANHAGLFRSNIGLGENVEPGTPLGTISGLDGEQLEEIRAPRHGMVAILRRMASVQPGDRLVQLFYRDSP